MRHCYTFFCFFFALLLTVNAQTPVSGSVYGKWTLANSPYLVQGHLYVSGGLEIDPGVEVIFQGYYQINVYDVLDAVGTASQPIIFRAQDTTGWHNKSQPLGGWAGIIFMDMAVANDSSTLTYCNIQDLKPGFPVVGATTVYGGIQIERSLTISHCKFSHSIDKEYITGNTIKFEPKGNDSLEVAYCEMYGNQPYGAVVDINGYWGGYQYFHHNVFHDNKDCAGISGLLVNGLIEQNEWYDNIDNSQVGGGPISIMARRVVIRRNKFHHNTSIKKATITCMAGMADIDANLICNNQQLENACGYSKGSSGIHLSYSYGGTSITEDSTLYVVHNNVIANNSSYSPGGGIVIYDAKVYIMNNHFVNNHALALGSAIHSFGANSKLYIKNNLFRGNDNDVPNNPPNNLNYTSDISLFGGAALEFDYNWIEKPFSQFVRIDTSIVFTGVVGDTTHNILGTDPQLVAPTPASGINNNAVLANFALLPNSACINQASLDTTNCYVSDTDYLNNARIVTRLDIGAFEYKNFVSITEASPLNANFSAFPNPTQDELYLVFPEASGNLRLIDNAGRDLWTKELTDTEMQVSLKSFPSGFYYLIWESKAGYFAQKVVRE
ncbi:MAG: choice-of-anchor Q domain-containing protein [Bacteroidia bacterium]